MNKALKFLLQQESQKANELIQNILPLLKNAPDGNLLAYKHHTNFQYFQQLPKGRRYIRKEDRELAIKLAQKEYYTLLVDAASELRDLTELLTNTLDQNDYNEIASKMQAQKQALITPCFLTDEQYAAQWQEEKFEHMAFDESVPEIYSNKGERVRSKTEKIIADMLANLGIPYRYEAPLYLSGLGTVHPDFTMLKIISRENIYWEHFGMMDDEVYCDRALRKINAYIRNGYIPGKNLLLTYETRNSPVNMKNVELQLRSILEL